MATDDREADGSSTTTLAKLDLYLSGVIVVRVLILHESGKRGSQGRGRLMGALPPSAAAVIDGRKAQHWVIGGADIRTDGVGHTTLIVHP